MGIIAYRPHYAVKAGKFIKDALKYAKDKIKQKHLEGKYLFTPSPENLEVIKSLENSVTYKRAKELLSIHPSFTLLRLGLYINRLNESDRKEKTDEVKKQSIPEVWTTGTTCY